MKIAVTGGTGFVGRYILRELAGQGFAIRAWKRQSSDLSGLEDLDIEWSPGDLTCANSIRKLVAGCDAVVHAALWKPGDRFQGGEGDPVRFAEVNITGSLRLVTSAIASGVERFVFLSSGAVHDVILDDRPLDEAHPCWPASHYGAHKAAIEKFVHSFAADQPYNICALRPTGVYGLNHPASRSRWYDLVRQVARGETLTVSGGGKVVHAADVARATSILLAAEDVAGQAFNCCDRYISDYEVASLAREISGSAAEIRGEPKTPQHQIETGKLRDKGMSFGGTALLQSTVRQLVAAD